MLSCIKSVPACALPLKKYLLLVSFLLPTCLPERRGSRSSLPGTLASPSQGARGRRSLAIQVRGWGSVCLRAGPLPRELGKVQSVGNVGKLTPSVEYHAGKRRTKCGRDTVLRQGQGWGLPNSSWTCSIVEWLGVGSRGRGQGGGCTG